MIAALRAWWQRYTRPADPYRGLVGGPSAELSGWDAPPYQVRN